ncbi:endonuclease III [Natribacillus halophilus]|uniref:Endonuclease III n=1 Tax=Natribacillus halophilus TaxID=549003 RepID=A0A1G8J9S9_9BACI|nr:endonuclease III [Natribacillus halophilus]SDI28028.1 DNA-(apurinic or apyrimidinic site) lyase /endonuclease III [Natribacillus halophilus]
MLSKRDTVNAIETMEEMFPEAKCELWHRNAFELLVAVILSAQSTDALINKVTPGLFEKYMGPEDIVAVEQEELEQDIRTIGLFRSKAKNLQKMSHSLITQYDGEVPADRDELMTLAGVGRKTANVVSSVAFDFPAIAVDTHVERVSKRLGICRWKDSVLEVEKTLMDKLPEEKWSKSHHLLIFFGRYHCKSRNPQCPECPLLSKCREGQKRMKNREMDTG